MLTLPVLFAVMAHEVFGAGWVPEPLLNGWVQVALITPVMFYTGWPIHRTGWLTLAHRGADMNSLITLGTSAADGYRLLVTLASGLLPADMREVYFGAVGVITLTLLGRLLEARAKAGTGEAIRAPLGLQARTPGCCATAPRSRSQWRTWPSVTRCSSAPARRYPGRRGGAVRALGGGRVGGHRGIDLDHQTAPALSVIGASINGTVSKLSSGYGSASMSATARSAVTPRRSTRRFARSSMRGGMSIAVSSMPGG